MNLAASIFLRRVIISVRIFKLHANFGVNFNSEVVGFEGEVAQRLAASGKATEGEMVDGEFVPFDSPPVPAPDVTTGGTEAGQWKFDKTTDPFVTDGISQEAAKALHAVGLHTVDAVRAFIAATPEGEIATDRVGSIDGVSDKQAEKIVSLYSAEVE